MCSVASSGGGLNIGTVYVGMGIVFAPQATTPMGRVGNYPSYLREGRVGGISERE